jgi:ABC-type multidrug transport system permease subunit
MNRWNELKELTRIRLLLFLRQPESIFWVFVFPVILSAVLGFAFRSSGPAPSKIGVVRGPGAEALQATLGKVERVEIELVDAEDGRRKLRRAAIDVLVEPASEPGALPGLVLDPQREEGEAARLRVLLALGQTPPAPRITEMNEAGARYIDFLFPGLIGANLMGTSLWMIGYTVAEIRQKKLLKRMLVTPMHRSSFLLSFLLSRLLFFTLETAALVAFGTLALGIPFRSDVLSFGLLCLLGAVVFSGLGLLTASRTRTTQGTSGLMNLIMMPMWLLSGVFFSYERFPEAVHPLLRALPLTALNDALRALLIDGAGLLGIGVELAVLAAWGVVAFFVSLAFFRWE